MRLSIHVELDYHYSCPTDVLLAVEAAQLPDQILVEDLLDRRRRRARCGRSPAGKGSAGAPGCAPKGRSMPIIARLVDVDRQIAPIDSLPMRRRGDLPAELIPYLWPSRYCEADRFEAFVERKFGDA